jgi:hypothetical protein
MRIFFVRHSNFAYYVTTASQKYRPTVKFPYAYGLVGVNSHRKLYHVMVARERSPCDPVHDGFIDRSQNWIQGGGGREKGDARDRGGGGAGLGAGGMRRRGGATAAPAGGLLLAVAAASPGRG